MAIPLHIQLLKKLKNAGIGVVMDISPFMVANFKKPSLNMEEYKKGMRPGILFIEDLTKRNFIHFDEHDINNETALLNVLQDERNTVIKWFDTMSLYLYITSIGLDYLDQYENNKLSKRANLAIIFSVFITIILSAATVLITSENLSFSKDVFKYSKKNDITMKNINKRVDSLSMRIPKIISPQIKNKINSN